MFLSADIVVKGVMIGLAFASVLTWTAWLAKKLRARQGKARVAPRAQDRRRADSLRERRPPSTRAAASLPALIEAASLELRRSSDVHDKQSIKERVGSRLERLEVAAGRDMNWGTGVLATIGATAPFVGLFGTVWGIMNSFIGISKAQTTNLAVVAPGIAEALLATALGLFAAIPAVIIYNQLRPLHRRLQGARRRQLGRGAAPGLARSRPPRDARHSTPHRRRSSSDGRASATRTTTTCRSTTRSTSRRSST